MGKYNYLSQKKKTLYWARSLYSKKVKPSYCEVVVDEFWPVEQISQSVEGSQLAAKCFLPFVIGSRVRAPEIIYWSHHTQTWHKEVENSQSIVNIGIETGEIARKREK